MISTTDPYFSTLSPPVNDLFARRISSPEAAYALASTTLSDTETIPFDKEEQKWYDEYGDQNTTERLWIFLLQHARESPEKHPILIDLFLHISTLPSPMSSEGTPLRDIRGSECLYWSEVPRLSWKINSIYNHFSIPLGMTVSEHSHLLADLPGVLRLSTPSGLKSSDRRSAITEFANVNKFIAQLLRAKEELFNYRIFALWTFRGATETPWENVRHRQPLEPYVRAAVGWLEESGADIYEWEDEWKYGPGLGDRGGGGPLWTGKHGFCKERWVHWRERFERIAGGEKAGANEEDVEGTRRAAERASVIMRKIEDSKVYRQV